MRWLMVLVIVLFLGSFLACSCLLKSTASASCALPRLILLQHINERRRASATGSLLLENEDVRTHLNTVIWTWSGRNDNDLTNKFLMGLQNPQLLWTESGKQPSLSSTSCPESESSGVVPPAFILLDGTWQEVSRF